MDIDEELKKSKENIEVSTIDGNIVLDKIKSKALPKTSIKTRYLLLASGILSAIVITLICVFAFNKRVEMLDGKYRVVYENVSQDKEEETWIIKKWDIRTTLEKYPTVLFNDNNYEIWSTLYSTPTDKKYIGDEIGTATAKGYDEILNESHYEEVKVYKILKVNSNAAIAVKFQKDDNYYSFCNNDYEFGTIGDFISDLNLKEYASFGNITYKYVNNEGNREDVYFKDVLNEEIFNAIFSDVDTSIYMKDDIFSSHKLSYSISFTVEAIGRCNLALNIYRDGYVSTNLFAYRREFYIGNEAEEFINYVDKNYLGYVIRYKSSETVSSESSVTKSMGYTATVND